ncbi:MAG: glycosyltransferase family A protein [Cyanobium sp.]
MSQSGTSRAIGLSVVTVCMNRLEHLLSTAVQVSAWSGHQEHLIVDWSSAEPVRREQLPADPRIRLLRVEAEASWNLCRAYNFAVARARGDWILKLDADTWPTPDFDPQVAALRQPGDGQGQAVPCVFGSGPEGRKGQFLMARQLFAAVGGFNEHLIGYGFDDKDLQARLAVHTGRISSPIPESWIGVIPHSDAERAGQGRSGRFHWLEDSRGLAAMRASRLSNRLLAAHCPWSGRAGASVYREASPGVWQVDPATIPRLPAEVADEIDHARRMTFWGCFLAIPEIFLEVLPFSLFPQARQGRWDVRWWHRLWWHSGRRLLELPVLLLAFTRGILRGWRWPG